MRESKDQTPARVLPKTAALIFCRIAGASALVLAAFAAAPVFRAGDNGWPAAAESLALALGGLGILRRNRLSSVMLPLYLLAKFAGTGKLAAAAPSPAAAAAVFFALALGTAGTFSLDRRRRIKNRGANPGWVAPDIAASFTRIAGISGFSFGVLGAMFSLAEMSGFTPLDLGSALLTILFAFLTLKRQVWAAAGQILLSLSGIALAHARGGVAASPFSFFPLFLLGAYLIGLAGIISQPPRRRQEDRKT